MKLFPLTAMVLCLACGGAATPPPEDAACTVIREKLSVALDAAMTARGATGAAAVEVDGCSFHGSTGVPAGGLFRIGSVTKTFVSTLVLMLQAEGRLSLDGRVSDHVSGIPGGDGITVRMLLGHTSGLFNYTEDQAFWEAAETHPPRAFTPRELVAVAAGHAPDFPPGKGFHYSNTNYIVAGMIAEAVGGKPVGAQIRERILVPVGLDHTYFDGEEKVPPGLVSGYERSDHGDIDVTYTEDPSGAWAAGALVSTADDVNRFFAKLLGGELLGPAQMQEMTTWTKTSWPGVPGYGLGLSEHGTPLGMSYGHVGSIDGYDAWSARVDGRGVTITVLSNVYGADAMGISDSLAGALK